MQCTRSQVEKISMRRELSPRSDAADRSRKMKTENQSLNLPVQANK